MSLQTRERPAHLHPINPRRDLDQIADLVELCFADWMDDEGRMYIRQMRQAAREARLMRPIGMRVEGFVWEEQGRIIGNVTLIPFQQPGKLLYLVANVAVHPDYRRLGIARQLTHASMNYARERNAQACWLQVRDDNPGAIKLYRLLGFVDRALRSTWQREPGPCNFQPQSNVEIHSRRRRSWPNQLSWLQQVYPSEVRWNMHFEPDRLRPSLGEGILGWFTSATARHWEAHVKGRPAGFASWYLTRQLADPIWLAVDPDREEPAMDPLLTAVVRGTDGRRPLVVNYPAGRGATSFENNGFTLRNTLLWMEAPFRKS